MCIKQPILLTFRRDYSLGDWIVNRDKFPFGFAGLSRELNAMGIKLGLWFEPEMISEDSLVARLHPDWILRTVGLTKQISRNQYGRSRVTTPFHTLI